MDLNKHKTRSIRLVSFHNGFHTVEKEIVGRYFVYASIDQKTIAPIIESWEENNFKNFMCKRSKNSAHNLFVLVGFDSEEEMCLFQLKYNNQNIAFKIETEETSLSQYIIA